MGGPLAYLLGSFVLIGKLGSPKQSGPKPAALSEFNLPVAEEGTPQCVIFGDCWTPDWQVLSYGNLRTRKIKTKSGK